MEEETGIKDDVNGSEEKNQKEEIFTKVVRAGKRTYFFDVKSTRSEDYYLTITESKRRFSNESGKFFYEKHKLFLYREDFEKFLKGLDVVMKFIETGEVPAPDPEDDQLAAEEYQENKENKTEEDSEGYK